MSVKGAFPSTASFIFSRKAPNFSFSSDVLLSDSGLYTRPHNCSYACRNRPSSVVKRPPSVPCCKSKFNSGICNEHVSLYAEQMKEAVDYLEYISRKVFGIFDF